MGGTDIKHIVLVFYCWLTNCHKFSSLKHTFITSRFWWLVFHTFSWSPLSSYNPGSSSLRDPLAYGSSSPPPYTSLSKPPSEVIGPGNLLAHAAFIEADLTGLTPATQVGMELCEFMVPQLQQHKIMDHSSTYTCVWQVLLFCKSKNPYLFQLATSSSSFAFPALFIYPKRKDSFFSLPFLTQKFPIITKKSSRKT